MFDAMEGSVAPQLEEFVRTDEFADMATAFAKMQADFQERAERSMRQTWHFWNLPAGSDVKRLSDQVASLERRVRSLDKRLEHELDELHETEEAG